MSNNLILKINTMEITQEKKVFKTKEQMSRKELIEEIERLEYYIQANLERNKTERAFQLQTNQIQLIKYLNN